MEDLYALENKLHAEGYRNIIGLDEAGRGAMAGPVVVAGVILPEGFVIPGLNDSKKLTAAKREVLYRIIKKEALEYRISFITAAEVDRLNVYQASRVGMLRCIKKTHLPLDYVLTDAMPLDVGFPLLSIVKGDGKCAAIAAASIMAKVTRDRYMISLAKVFPEYGFEQHKGYVTKMHLARIAEFGACCRHRQSFAPVKKIKISKKG